MTVVAPLQGLTTDAEYRRGVILCLCAGVCWSVMALGIRFADDATVWHILFYRSVAMTPILFALIAYRSGGRPVARIRATGFAGVLGGLGLVFAFAGGIYAIQTTSVANAMFLFATAPFFTAALSWVVLRERVRRATWIAMAVGAVGIAMMVAEGFALGRADGNIAALASAFGFAAFTLCLRWGRIGDMIPAVFLGGVFAMIVSGAVIQSQGLGFDLPMPDLAVVLGLGVFQLGLGLSLYTFGSKHVPAAELALLSLTEVVLAPIWVWLVLGEGAEPEVLTGGAILIAALAANALSGMRRPPPQVM
jgi:DME family drug/metabolite transporter